MYTEIATERLTVKGIRIISDFLLTEPTTRDSEPDTIYFGLTLVQGVCSGFRLSL